MYRHRENTRFVSDQCIDSLPAHDSINKRQGNKNCKLVSNSSFAFLGIRLAEFNRAGPGILSTGINSVTAAERNRDMQR